MPWSLLNFDPQRNGYIVSLSKDDLKSAPAYSIDELTENDGQNIRTEVFSYYKVSPYWN